MPIIFSWRSIYGNLPIIMIIRLKEFVARGFFESQLVAIPGESLTRFIGRVTQMRNQSGIVAHINGRVQRRKVTRLYDVDEIRRILVQPIIGRLLMGYGFHTRLAAVGFRDHFPAAPVEYERSI